MVSKHMKTTEKKAAILVASIYLAIGWVAGGDADLNDPMYWILLLPPCFLTLNLVAFYYGKTILFGYGHCSADSAPFVRVSALVVSILFASIYMWYWFSGQIYPIHETMGSE